MNKETPSVATKAKLDRQTDGVPFRRLKFAAPLRNERGDISSADPSYIGMDRIESWTGRLLEVRDDPNVAQEESSPDSTTNRFENGDVLFGKLRPYLAKAWLADRDGCSTTEFLVLSPTDILHGAYLRYLMLRPNFITEVDASTFGAKMPRANWDFIGGIHIPMPPISTQKRIATYLDSETARIDALVAEKERMLSLIEQKRAALTSRAVTRGLNPKAPTKPSGLDWLGEIPKHWKVQRCATLFIEKDERGEPELPLLNVSLNTGVTLRIFSEDKIESMASNLGTMKIAREGDLVFNKMRFWQGAAGIAPAHGLVSPDYTVATISGQLLPEYVEKLFRISRFNAIVRRYSYGMVDDRLRLYWDGFKNIRIPLPPLAEQEAIITHIQAHQSRANALKTALPDSIALLKERRSALITAAVTGRLAISA